MIDDNETRDDINAMYHHLSILLLFFTVLYLWHQPDVQFTLHNLKNLQAITDYARNN